MKTGVSVLALAAGAAATGFRNFPPFSCPENTDNRCTDFQKGGFSFGDLNPGPFSQYKDFSWKGFTCGNSGGGGGGGGGIFGRNPSGRKIGGVCTSDKRSSPSFSCDTKVDKFSVGSIFVQPEFDCDLEFHYDMPDGKTCKHRNSCKKSGSNVVNKQCGGAKGVTIVYPSQPNKPKPTCSVDIHTISFDCNPPRTTTARTTSATTVSTSASITTSTTPSIPTPPTLPTSSTSPATSSAPTSPATDSSTTSAASSTPPTDTSSKTIPPAGDSTSSTLPVNSQSTSELTTTVVTSFQTTSTIFSTVVSTITSCAPTVPNCPGNGVTTTVVTVAISTTVCPVTETRTTVLTTTTSSPAAPPNTQPATNPGGGASTLTTSVRPGTSTTANSPVETLPCPSVVPACLNTFLFSVGCKDNSEANCYCPDTIFVKNVFECIYAHGETDAIISEAVIFFQGICAPHLPSNPGIATGADITKFITVTATPTAVAPILTTVVVDATTVVPCTDEAGQDIPNSSTTVIVSTTLAVPQVGFATNSGIVGVVPVTTAQPIFENNPAPGAPGVPGVPSVPGAPAAPGSGPATTTFSIPVGTGGLPAPTSPAVVTAGSGRVTAGLGLSLGLAVLAVMGL